MIGIQVDFIIIGVRIAGGNCVAIFLSILQASEASATFITLKRDAPFERYSNLKNLRSKNIAKTLGVYYILGNMPRTTYYCTHFNPNTFLNPSPNPSLSCLPNGSQEECPPGYREQRQRLPE